MPAKGFTYNREKVMSKDFFQRFIESNPQYKDKLTLNQFEEIIEDSNSLMANIVINDEQGFKLPENMGYVVVIRYKTTKKAIDWKNSKLFKKQIFHNNLHSYGFTYHIKWFKAGIAKFKHNYIYKLEPARKVKRAVAALGKEGKVYLDWKITDFWSTSKLDRMYRKKYKIND